jgi:hypothetical protein
MYMSGIAFGADVRRIGLRVRAPGMVVAAVLALGVSGVVTPVALAVDNPDGARTAADAAAFECPDVKICVFDSADGVGDSFVVNIRWAGGYDLAAKGWNDRASAYNNRVGDATYYLYDADPGGECWHLRATVAPNTSGALPPEADNNVDLVANLRYPECAS